MGLIDWLKGRGTSDAPDGFRYRINDPLATEHTAISQLLGELSKERDGYLSDLSKLETYQEIAALDREKQARLVGALVQRFIPIQENLIAIEKKFGSQHFSDPAWRVLWSHFQLLGETLSALLRKKLPLRESEIDSLLRWLGNGVREKIWIYPITGIVAAVENFATENPLTETTMTLLSRCLTELHAWSNQGKEYRIGADRIAALLNLTPELPIHPGEAWADSALEELRKLSNTERLTWIALLNHAKAGNSSTPTAKWIKSARPLLDGVGLDKYRITVGKWFFLTQTRRNLRALTDRQWQARCAELIFSRALTELHTAHGGGREFWPAYYEIQKAIRTSENPWEFVRTFQTQKIVRTHFGDRAPRLAVAENPPAYDPPEDHLISDSHMDILRGLAWFCSLQEDRELARSLTILALSSYRKVVGRGPRAVRVGNACVTALGMMPGLDAVGQLALLKVKVKFGGAQAAIGKALNAAAEREGLPREELEEMAVPAYGLTSVGQLIETIGDFTAELSVTGSKTAEIIWRRADGKVQKSLPAALKKEFADEVKELVAAKKDIENMLPALAERIDGLFLQQKSWSLETWLERYLEHPLVGTLTRRLIWNFTIEKTTTPGLWVQAKLVDRLGHPIALDTAKTRVTLWHPLDQSADVVLGWRAFLEEWQIVQPFKQAHREVYLRTPAEERTSTYSNRFAAHILKQHQFNALASARSWKNQLRLMVDNEYPPTTRFLPHWGLRAEFWVEGAGNEYGTDTNGNGTYLYLATDQVRFYRLEDQQLTAHAGGGGYGPGWRQQVVAEPIPLVEIPALVLSEIMRDVDLFVGVASVGNDPAWADGGRSETQRDAWTRHAFGDLTATAQTRRDLLQRLIPKLKIADRCAFADKFLVVRGDLHTYKIHLGSGNILMSPNDRYLCIVAGSNVKTGNDKVFLPFEGDRTLSVIISKAFLLAADKKITDPTILGQINH